MKETPGISLRQAIWLFINSRLIITLVFIPAFSELTHQDVLISMLAAIPMTMLEGLVFLALWMLYPKHTLIEYSSSILGRYLGKIVGLLYVWYFLHQTAITLRVFENFLDTRFFPSTPRGVITAAILMVAAYVLFKGLETLGRCSELLVPYILFWIIVIALLVLNHADWKNLTPLFENGLGPVIYGAVPTTTRWSEFAWMAMIIPFIVDKKKIKNAVFTGIVVTNMYFLILMVPIVVVFGPALTANTQFPTYALVEVISVGQFLERIEAILLGMWVFGAFLKIGIFYYVSVLGAAQLFGVKNKQPLILPIGLLIFVLSLFLFSNIVELRAFGKTAMTYDFFFIFIIPCILLMAHWAKKHILTHKKRNKPLLGKS